jgi:formylglycine-generating enzyme required for sulfatase activity
LKDCHGQGPYSEVFDMAGNVSEWVDERGKALATSIGSRGSTFDQEPLTSGCNGVNSSAEPTVHSPFTGIRCCAD